MNPGARRERASEDGEEGSGTVAAIAVVLVAAALAAVVLIWGAAMTQRTRVQAVADLAALAGADISATAQWEDVGSRPCRAAAQVAAENDVELDDCRIDGVDALVTLSEHVTIAGFSFEIRARARAGVDP